MSTARLTFDSNRRSVELLIISVALVVAPHIFNLAAPVLAFFSVLVAWRLAATRKLMAMPGRWLLLVLTVAGACLVFAQYHRFYGREAGAALFSIGLGLKLMELKTTRDAYLAIFLAFFVAVTQYLFSQSIPMALYTLAISVLLVTTLISLNSSPAFGLSHQLRLAGIMVLQTLPLMAMLFVLFPRIPGPLWKLPDDEPRARSGLSDTMEPGSIGKLGLSQDLAFRVQFEGSPPAPRLRYWRGPVFWETDGKRWSLSAEDYSDRTSASLTGSQETNYTLTMEPSHQRWVFALDMPTVFPHELKRSADFVLLARDKILERSQFQLASRTEYVTGPLTAREKARGLKLPDGIDPRLIELVNSWKEERQDGKALVQRALAYFRQQPFYYTLNPPLIPGDPIAGFLFETRKGFCEHYATAFVVLMRLAGLPARVVTGYQGGLWNSVGRFIEVRQADAHAWAEVWLEESGWTRFDPTAAVAPERIEYGLDVDMQVDLGEIRFNPGSRLSEDAMALASLLKQARLVWDSVDYKWNLWILSYGPQNQERLLRLLGITDWQRLAIWMAGLGTLILAALASLILPARGHANTSVQRAYTRFLKKAARAGFEKGPAEGASSFCERICQAFPLQARQIQMITADFQELRYGRSADPGRLTRLKRSVRRLALKSGISL